MAKAEKLQAWLRFGRFTITWECESRNYKMYEKCICDCWKVKWVSRSNLLRGRTNSCGCTRAELLKSKYKTHWMTWTRIYKIFHDMKRRCECEKDSVYKWYGGKWIKCLWNTFDDFYMDMWTSYNEHVNQFWEKETTIDRIDGDWDYCKENCRWATKKEQNNNRCSSRSITYKWVVYPTMKSICDELWLNYKCFKKRLEDWWDIIDAIETPKNWRYKKKMS